LKAVTTDIEAKKNSQINWLVLKRTDEDYEKVRKKKRIRRRKKNN